MPLRFQRDYASTLKRDGNVDAKIGDNWSHNFAWRLRADDATHVSIISARGRVIPFAKSGATWSLGKPLDVPYQLVQNASGYLLGDPVAEMIYTFDGGGSLTAIED